MPDTSAQTIKIPSDLDALPQVHEQIKLALEKASYTERDLWGIKLALEEALVNAIRHGNGSDPAKQVVITYAIDAKRLEISVQDEGSGFNPHAVPDPTLDENLEKPHGRGVMLMNNYMTDVRYNEQGNCVTLVKERE